MRGLVRHRSVWIGLALLGFAAAFAWANFSGGNTRADELPGTLSQSASVSSQGVTIESESATFSGTAVLIDLAIQLEGDERTVVGVASSDADMAGVPASTSHSYSEGRTTLRFPVEAWPASVASAPLSIRAVLVRDASGKLHKIDGDWALDIRLPEGEAAEAARAVQALEPAVLEVAGHEVPIHTFRTQAATIVRYALPETILPMQGPVLRAGEQTLRPTLAEQREAGAMEAWFEATPDGVPLVLVFEKLMVSDPDGEAWTVEFELAPFDPPGKKEGVQERHLEWTALEGSDGPELLDVLWERRLELDVQLSLTVEGLWDPGPNGVPIVHGDGAQLRVYHIGLRPAQHGKAAHTIITLELPRSAPPRHIVVKSRGKTRELPSAEVALTP